MRRSIVRALAIVAVPLLVAVLLIKTETGRGWILSIAAARIEHQSGIVLEVGGTDLSVLGGRVRLHDVSVRHVDRERPFVSAGEVDVTLQWAALLARPFRLMRVVVHEVDADTAMLPPGRGGGGSGRGEPIPLSVDEVVWESGSVGPWAGGDRFAVWFEHAMVHEIGGRGRLNRGVLEVEESSGVLRLVHPDRPPIDGDVDLTGRIDLDGTLRDAKVSIAADGLQARASIRGDSPGRFRLEGAVDASLGTLFPDLTVAGDAHVEGLLERNERGLAGDGELRFSQIPAPLLEPWMNGALASVRLDEKHLDADGNYRIDIPLGGADARALIEIDLDARLMRGRETLLAADLSATSNGPEEHPVSIGWSASLMPERDDRCVTRGRLRLPAWNRTSGALVEDASVEASFADLGDAAERFGLLENRIGALHPTGAVSLDLRVNGPLDTLQLEGSVDWSHEGASILRATATSDDLEEGLALSGIVLAEEPGRREWSTELRPHAERGWAAAVLVGGRVSLLLPDPYGAGEQFAAVYEALYPSDPTPPWVGLLLSADPKLGGALNLDMSVEGALRLPTLTASFHWQPGLQETLSVIAAGTFDLDSLKRSELQRLEAEADNLSFLRLAALLPDDAADRVRGGQFDARITASGPVTRPVAELRLTAEAVDIEGAPGASTMTLDLSATPDLWTVRDFAAEWSDPDYGVLSATATIEPDYPVRRLAGTLIQTGLPGSATRAEADVSFEEGLLRIERGVLVLESGLPGSFQGVVPLIDEFGIAPLTTADGEMSVTLDRLDLGSAFAPLLELEPRLKLLGTVSAGLDVDLRDFPTARGQIRLDGLSFILGEEKVEAVGPLDVVFRDGRLTLQPGRLLAASSALSGTAPLDIRGTARFEPSWRITSPPGEMLREIAITVDGTVNASLIAPIFGATGTGPVELNLQTAGSPTDFSVSGAMRGETARFLLPDPFPLRIEDLDVVARTEGTHVVLEKANAKLNGGNGSVQGVIGGDGDLDLRGRFNGVRCRLGFGVTARLDGDVQLQWPSAGRRLLSGDIVVDRALMSRDINLDREILRAIFDPDLDTGTSLVLDTVDVDLSVTTDQGLAIRNNLAELKADWSRLDVQGTLSDPLMSGRVDVAPGGRVHLLGETLRIDEAALSWASTPPGDPEIYLQTTSSREDPTISQSWRSGWYSADLGPGQGGQLGFWEAATANTESTLGTNLANYTQDRLYGSLGRVLTRTELSYEPLPLFGETDTEARFTVSQDLSSNLSFIASNNPREAEDQTYILDLHAFRSVPSLRAQVFTGDSESDGVTLQQTVVLGKHKGSAESADPLVRERAIAVPENVSERKLRRALGFRKGDPFPKGAELDVEIDVSAALRQVGYPDARVDVRLTSVEKQQVDLAVEIDPGPRVGFTFEGASELPRSIRRRIVAEYRSEEDEARAFGEMRSIAARALRTTGCFETQVDVEVVPPPPEEERHVLVRTACARTARPDVPLFLGLPQTTADWAAAGFSSQLSRIELAAGIRDADDHLRRRLDAVGYPDAQIVERTLSDDGAHLEVVVDPGERRFVDEVTLVNADETTRTNSKGLITIRAGDPLRRDWIATSARALTADLRRRGYDQATVRSVVEASPDDPTKATVYFRIEAGRPSEVRQIVYEGLRKSRPSWVAGVTDLRTNTELQREEISEARGRLYRTGVFERIRVTTESQEEPDEEIEAGSVRPTSVRFQLEEAPRYQLSYGGRWESDLGLGAVVDLVNRNTLGRGHSTGVRGIINQELRSLRLYHVIPRILASERSSLELFVEAKRENIEEVRSNVIEAWAQLTFPLSPTVQTRVYSVVGDRNILSGVPPPDVPLEEQVISPRFGWQMAYNTVAQGLATQRRRGFFFGLDVSGSYTGLGADLTTLGLFTQFKIFAPFGNVETGRFSWHQSYRAGLLTAVDEEIPFVDRLRAGGEFSVRGYPTNSLGPLDVDGTALGGELMLVMNQELHARVWNSLYGVLFFDAGNVWSKPSDFELGLFESVGFGARYTSPVGPLRLDVGFPLDRRPGDDSLQVYVGFGSVF